MNTCRNLSVRLCVLCGKDFLQLLQVVHNFRASPLLRTNELAQYFPGAVNHVSLRRPGGLIKVFKFFIAIMNGDESHPVFTNELLIVTRLVVIAHSDYCYLVTHPFLQEIQVWDFVKAGTTPSRPQIQNDNFATVIV